MVLSRLTKITSPGIKTDTNWVGNNANFTGVTTTATSFNIGVTTIHSTLAEVHNIKSTGIITATGAHFSGNVSIAGTLTYEDVTNIDSVGIITAPAVDVDDFLDVGSNIKLGNAGVITATSFVGSGAALTGIDATAIKDSGGNVKVQAQASGAMYTGIHTFSSGAEVGSNIKLGNAGVVTATTFKGDGDFVELDVDGHTNLDNLSVAGVSTFSDDVTFTGASYNLTWDKSDNKLKFAEFSGIRLGNNNELQIDHRGTSYILNIDSMPLVIGSNSLLLTDASTTSNRINCAADGTVVLYKSHSEKLRTKNYGIQVTGLTDTDSLLVSGISTLTGAITANGAIDLNADLDVDGHTNLDNVSIAGVTTTAGDLTVGSGGENSALGVRINSAYAQIKLPDGQTGANEKGTLFFGDGDDFTVVHDGYHNYVRSNNGWIIIKNSAGNNAVIIKGTNATEVYHATTKVFESTAKGIQVGTGVTIETNGQATYVGIVTASAFKLSDGSNVGGVESDSSYNTLGGSGAGAQLTGSSLRNTFFGWDAGTAETGGEKNTYLGAIAGKFQNSSNYNTGVGDAALVQNSGSFNTGVGYQALAGESERLTMEHNVAVGYNALRKLDDPGDFNVAVGSRSLENCVSGISNIAIGYKSLFTDSSGYDNVAIGSSSGLNLTTGSHSNVIVGTRAADAMQGNSSLNVFIGKDAFGNCTGGNQNVAIGYQALGTGSPSISGNVALGGSAGASVTDNYNTFVGHQAGDSLVHGGNNIIIGYNADASSTSADNEITLGNSSITKFRIPGINVTLKDNGGTPTQGHVLTVDGSGEAGFAAVSADLVNDTSPQLGGLLDGNGQTANFTGNNTGLGLPVGTTAQRPTASSYKGYIRFNDTDDDIEFSDGSTWKKINSVIVNLNSVSGNIFAGAASSLTLSGTGFLASGLVVNFLQSSDGINVNVTVTPTSDVAATVAVPASVYNNVTAGNAVTISATNSDGVTSGTINKTASSLPSGGNSITTSGSYRIHTFTSSGTWVNTIGSLSVEYLVIAGGGGGGSNSDVGGGGGAGGYLEGTTTASAQSYGVTVGNGGAGGCGGQGGGGGCDGSQGGNSSALGVTAIGGGGGGTRYNPGGNGGSGGGGGDGGASGGSGTSGQGHNGGNAPGMDTNNMNDQGAGGGAGSAASSWNPGSGKSSSITGSSVTYAKGGVGLNHAQWSQAAANTGNGGRGAYHQSQNTGGSGIVVIRYQL